MAHALTTFDRHYEGKVLLTEVPAGVDTKGFDYHYEGRAIVAEAAVAAGTTNPFSMGAVNLLCGKLAS